MESDTYTRHSIKTLQHLDSLKHLKLQLGHTNTSDKLYKWIDLILFHPSLEIVEFTNRSKGINLAQQFAHILETKCTLFNLNLEGNGLDKDSFRILSKALQLNGTLRCLSLRANKGGDLGIEAIVNSFVSYQKTSGLWKIHNTKLEYLDLSYNNVSDSGFTALGRMIKHNQSITSLHISGNDNTHIGIEAVAQGAAQNTSLKRLEIQGFHSSFEP